MKERENNKFTWGETVVIKNGAPSHLHPGEIASVCSVIKLDLEDTKIDSKLNESDWLYTVEFGDGTSIDIPECYLEKY